MSERKLTAEQRAALEADGEILVSASAGSGKTFVMVERMVSLVLAGKAEVSGILAVTFTNLAAAEMKERLRAAIVARINAERDASVRARLKEQLAQIGTADICTVHSFCTSVIRRYFYETDAAGNFRILDDTEAEKLKARAMDAVLDGLLEAEDASFALLASVYANARGFAVLRRTALEQYERITAKADYRAFLEGVPALYDEAHFNAVAAELYEEAVRRAGRLSARCEELFVAAADLLGSAAGKQFDYIQSRKQFAAAVCGAGDLFAASALAESVKFARKQAVPGKDDEALRQFDEALSALKEDADRLVSLLKGHTDRAEELARFLDSGKVAAALARFLLAFDAQYAAAKRRAGALDFADLEHKCLALLQLPQVRGEVAGRYTHVFVDEYQDVNPVQEQILSLVSGKNVFMVGDAKQSIYGFRGCSSAFFTQKYERLSAVGGALRLNRNFRSRSAVLDAVNTIFSKVMTRENGSVDYKATSRMAYDPEGQSGGKVSVALLPKAEKAEAAERGVYSVAEHIGQARSEEYAEGALVADIILEERNGRLPAENEEGSRNVEFGDIVVLTRKNKGNTGRLVAELIRRGIPVATEAEINVCDYPEVKNLLNVLQFLDNGSQDIPLAAALKSLGGLGDEELAAIRLFAGEKCTFVSACEAYAARGEGALAERLRAFYREAERLRLYLPVSTAAELCVRILREAGMELAVLAQPCGEERMARVRRFIAESGDLPVADFLSRLKNGGYKVGLAEKGGENAVRVMTIHKSKGLEFPIVIAAGLGGEFGSQDRIGVMGDDEYGFALPAYDTEAFRSKETLLRAAVKERLRRKRTEDEMRLLYVALTRARERLWMVLPEGKTFREETAQEANCFADFIDVGDFTENIVTVFGDVRDTPSARVLLAGEADEESRRAVAGRYRREYAHAAACRLPVKTSATALLREREAAEAEKAGQERLPFGLSALPLVNAGEGDTDLLAGGGYAAPAFSDAGSEKKAAYAAGGGDVVSVEGAQEGLSASEAELGTAYHAFLERADFSAPAEEETARVLAQMRGEGFAVLPDAAQAERILRMPVFSLLKGFTLRREQPFLAALPANLLYDTPAEDEVLVQGVMDLFAVRGEECLVIDYKYSRRDPARLAQDYAPQLRLYAAAAARVAGVKTVRTFIVNILRGFWEEV